VVRSEEEADVADSGIDWSLVSLLTMSWDMSTWQFQKGDVDDDVFIKWSATTYAHVAPCAEFEDFAK
jgi:hypothetical protein